MMPTMFSMAPAAPPPWPPWKRAVVTAGAGFLGSHLCERLLDAGVEVDCVDDLPAGSARAVEHLADSPGFRFLRRDISRPDCPGSLTGPYDLVLHLACPASSGASSPRSPGALDADASGTRTALAVAERDGARFLLASTCHLHGDPLYSDPPHADPLHADPGDIPRAADPVPVGALAGHDAPERLSEALTAAYATSRQADAGIVRVFPAYGPRMGPRDGGGLIPAFIRQALDGGPVTVPGDGSGTPSLCYVGDTVDGVLLVAASRSVRPVDIGGDPGATVEQIARRVIELTGSHARLRLTGARADTPEPPRPETGFAHELYGWTPRVPWEDGLKRTIASFLDRRENSS
ncbi:NAD-dependent epimerase/dehydratase family protein [Streptomyces sp. NPDC087844]|uniref:NAD-dependent epimerase/dehydratase family protein n=1 Tax=Streptomyces sp. NPDC087844 TaxID=3365805 RepID=UPI003821FAD0